MTTTSPALFYLFSAVLLFAGYRVITSRGAVVSALFLVLAFFSAACIWMLLHAEFLAIALVLVYVGAVMVLFLFVVMMLDINVDAMRDGFWRYFPAASFVGVIIALEMALVLLDGFRVSQAPVAGASAQKLGNTKLLGIEVYTNYLYPLQIAAVILLVAIIAAIALTLRNRKTARYTDPSEQVRVKKVDRLRIIKMAPFVEPGAANAASDATATNGGAAPSQAGGPAAGDGKPGAGPGGATPSNAPAEPKGKP